MFISTSPTYSKMAMNQYLLIPFLEGWTSIYQLFCCSPGVQGFDPLPNHLRIHVARQVLRAEQLEVLSNLGRCRYQDLSQCWPMNSVRKPWENWIFQVFNDTTHWKMLWWSLERFGHEFCEWSAMQSCFGPVSGTFLRTFGLKKGKHRSFKKPPFAMATMNFHAELLNGRRIAIPIPLGMTIRELKEELKVWRAVAAVLGLVCFWCGKER